MASAWHVGLQATREGTAVMMVMLGDIIVVVIATVV